MRTIIKVNPGAVFGIAVLLLMLIPATEVYGQKAGRKEVAVSGVVRGVDGGPVYGAVVTANDGSTVVFTGRDGTFSISGKPGSSILFEADGYRQLVYEIREADKPLNVVLQAVPLLAGHRDDVYLPMLMSEKQRYLIGAVSGTASGNLAKYPELLLSNKLQGRIMGLTAVTNVSGLGNNASTLYIRGLHRENSNGIVTVVDGMERTINDLMPEEIESIEVLKDAASKIMYGAHAANGVLVVTTKRGKANTQQINVSAEYGAGIVRSYPEYLGSYDYARLYNEARENDGLAPLYSQADLQGYRNSTGPYDLRYPDVDYIDYFLKNTSSYQKYSLEFLGGNDKVRYALVAGYTGNGGVQKVGVTPNIDRFNVRGNLDVAITDFLSANIGIGGVFDITQRGTLDHGQTFSAVATHRPNEYPITIPEEYIPLDTLGRKALGASFAQPDNLYGTLMYGGRNRDQNIKGQLNFGLDFDLGFVTKGLSASGYIAFDNYFAGREAVTSTVATYARRWVVNDENVEEPEFYIMKKTNKDDQNRLTSSYNLRSNAFVGRIDYKRSFDGAHRVSANLGSYYMMEQASGSSQDNKTLNVLLRGNYAWLDRYVIEASGALMGSNKFTGRNRYMMSWAGGLGWILSEENFMKVARGIDFLKLKASAGYLGYDRATDYFLYETRWYNNGTYATKRGTTISRVSFRQIGNPDLKWETSLEFNAGAEALLFDKKLWIEANYFHETRSNIIMKASSQYASLYGGLFPSINWGKVRNQGLEAEARYTDRTGDFTYSAGVNLIWSKNKVLRTDEPDYPEEYRRQTGRPSDAVFGYVSRGLFGRDVALEGHSRQTFGAYGMGDIAYTDLNGDGEIDTRDVRMIGNSFPRTRIGLEVELDYKGFGLYLQGVSHLGMTVLKNNAYFWNRGEDKYTDVVLDRWHAENNPNGNYPRLTTTQGTNNFRNSDFWLEKAGFFKLKNVELSYTFGSRFDMGPVKKLKIFARGTNLLTVSKFRGMDPEALNAGVSNYPVFMTVTGGVSLNF